MSAPSPAAAPTGWRGDLLLFLVAVAATALATWPLAGELFTFTRLTDLTLDDHVYWWDFWWLREALVVRHVSPFFCPDVFHPYGASLVVSPLALPYGFAALPFEAWFGTLHGAVVAVKVLGFFSFPVAVVGMARLTRAFGVGFVASALVGALFAFTPFRMLHLGRIHYLAGALVPWFLVAGLAATRQGRKRWIAVAALLFALAGATDPSLLLELVLAAVALWIVELRRGAPWRSALLRWGACGVGGTLLLAPLLVPFLRETGSVAGIDAVARLDFHHRPTTVQRILSPDVGGVGWLLLPALSQATWMDPAEVQAPIDTRSAARLAADFYDSFRPPASATAQGVETTLEALIALAVLAAAVRGLRQRGAVVLLALAALGFVLALGPTRSLGDTPIHLPYAWLARLVPGMAAGRYPPTTLRLLHLGLFLVAGLGSRGLSRPWSAGAVALALATFATGPLRPLQLAPVVFEQAHEIIARDPVPGAVLELPARLEVVLRREALGQILHGRPLLSGPLTRVPDAARRFFEAEPLVPRLLHPPPPTAADEPRRAAEIAENRAILDRYDVRWIVLRKGLEQQDPQAFDWLITYLQQNGLAVQRTREGHVLARVDRP